MKKVLYTCTRCGKQETVDLDPHKNEAPMEWAAILYRRVHTMQHEGQLAIMQTTSETHACGDCAQAVLDFLEAPAQAPRRSA